MNHTNKNPEYTHQDFKKKKKNVGKDLENKYLKAKINMDIISQTRGFNKQLLLAPKTRKTKYKHLP